MFNPLKELLKWFIILAIIGNLLNCCSAVIESSMTGADWIALQKEEEDKEEHVKKIVEYFSFNTDVLEFYREDGIIKIVFNELPNKVCIKGITPEKIRIVYLNDFTISQEDDTVILKINSYQWNYAPKFLIDTPIGDAIVVLFKK